MSPGDLADCLDGTAIPIRLVVGPRGIDGLKSYEYYFLLRSWIRRAIIYAPRLEGEQHGKLALAVPKL